MAMQFIDDRRVRVESFQTVGVAAQGLEEGSIRLDRDRMRQRRYSKTFAKRWRFFDHPPSDVPNDPGLIPCGGGAENLATGLIIQCQQIERGSCCTG